MQVKFVIEVIVDFLDPNKVPVAKTAVLRAAAGLNAKMAFLNDGQHPEVVCYSEDFFAGREDLNYLNEKMLQEQETPAQDEPVFSDEFMRALKGE